MCVLLAFAVAAGWATTAAVAETIALTDTVQLWVGADYFNINFFSGTIDDVRIYDRVLTAAELTILAAQ
jgi:hypothetical protein